MLVAKFLVSAAVDEVQKIENRGAHARNLPVQETDSGGVTGIFFVLGKKKTIIILRRNVIFLFQN